MGLRIKIILPLLLSGLLIVMYLYAFWLPRLLADAEDAYKGAVINHLDSVAEGLVPCCWEGSLMRSTATLTPSSRRMRAGQASSCSIQKAGFFTLLMRSRLQRDTMPMMTGHLSRTSDILTRTSAIWL